MQYSKQIKKSKRITNKEQSGMSLNIADQAIIRVSDNVIRDHEQFLVKHTVQIVAQPELIQGELSELPSKTIELPKEYLSYETMPNMNEFRMKQGDPMGEKKITKFGSLVNGSRYLVNIFRLPDRGPIYFSLLDDVMKALTWQGTEERFLEIFSQLYPINANAKELDFLKEAKLISESSSTSENIKMVSIRSVYVVFGASIIACGMRLVNDYWESLGRKQGFTSHHRVFRLPRKVLELVKTLKPAFFYKENKVSEGLTKKSIVSESPYLNITEQPSIEVREEYAKRYATGQHITSHVPGQSISGSLELSALFKIPKYHSKNSFLQAIQMKILDIPIGRYSELMEAQLNNGLSANATESTVSLSSLPGTPTIQGSNIHSVNTTSNLLSINNASNTSVNKPQSRMLSSIMDMNMNMNNKTKKTDDTEVVTSRFGNNRMNTILNIHGWKFDSLPVSESDNLTGIDKYSAKGIPTYSRDRLLHRLKKLTPNQIKELEHLHDSVSLNTGLQKVRKTRFSRWTKYWQYKSGIPIGLQEDQIETYKTEYLKEMLEYTTVTETYNEETNNDEIRTTKRVPNANFLDYSNIRGFNPPYALYNIVPVTSSPKNEVITNPLCNINQPPTPNKNLVQPLYPQVAQQDVSSQVSQPPGHPPFDNANSDTRTSPNFTNSHTNMDNSIDRV